MELCTQTAERMLDLGMRKTKGQAKTKSGKFLR